MTKECGGMLGLLVWHEEEGKPGKDISRDTQIAQMHDAGLPTKEIGLAFGISVQGVHAVLKRLRARKRQLKGVPNCSLSFERRMT